MDFVGAGQAGDFVPASGVGLNPAMPVAGGFEDDLGPGPVQEFPVAGGASTALLAEDAGVLTTSAGSSTAVVGITKTTGTGAGTVVYIDVG
jgi:hypothetical protein